MIDSMIVDGLWRLRMHGRSIKSCCVTEVEPAATSPIATTREGHAALDLFNTWQERKQINGQTKVCV